MTKITRSEAIFDIAALEAISADLDDETSLDEVMGDLREARRVVAAQRRLKGQQ